MKSMHHRIYKSVNQSINEPISEWKNDLVNKWIWIELWTKDDNIKTMFLKLQYFGFLFRGKYEVD